MNENQKKKIKNLIEARLGMEFLDINKSSKHGCILYLKDHTDVYFHLNIADNELFNLFSLNFANEALIKKNLLPTIMKNNFYSQLQQMKDIFASSKNQKNYGFKLLLSLIDIASGHIQDIEKSKTMNLVYTINIPIRSYNNEVYRTIANYEMAIAENEHLIRIKPLKLSEYDNNKDDELLTFRKDQAEIAIKFIFLDIIKCLHYTSFYPFDKNIHSFEANRENENLPFENFSKLETLDEMIYLYKKELLVQEMFEI